MNKNKWAEMSFEDDKPDYGQEIPIKEWQECVECGGFTDDDGTGYWMKNGKVHTTKPFERGYYGDDVCFVDEINEAIENGIDAVMWFNK